MSTNSIRSGSFRAMQEEDSHCAEIVLAGSALVFSKRFVRLLAYEFEDQTVRRASGDLTAFLRNFDPAARTMLIIEDTVAAEAEQVPDLLRDVARKAEVVIAYRSLETARRLYRIAQRDPDLSSLRFLPLEIQMDRWMSLLEILACGHGHVPHELLEAAPADVSTRPPCSRAMPVDSDDKPTFDILTPREQEVLRLVADGLQNKAIAEHLGRSEHTVKIHIQHINAKLSVSNRTAAATWYATHVAASEGVLSDE